MKKILSYLILFSSFFFFTKAQVFAEDSFSLKIYPPVAYLSVKPGAAIDHSIELLNDGQFSLRVTPQLVDFHTDENTGKVILEQNTQNTYISIDSNFENWGKDFTLKPGEKKDLPLTISIPSGADYEELHLSVLFQAEQLLYDEGSIEGRSLVSGILASNIILLSSIDEEDRGELTIDTFSLPKFVDSFMGINFSAKVANIGVNAKAIDGHIKVSHWPDQDSEIYQLYPDMVLASSKRVVRGMSETDVSELEKLEESKDVILAAGEDFAEQKENLIRTSLKSDFLYKRSFLLGTYDFELKVGDDILQKRVIALPFSLLAFFIILPILYSIFKFLIKKTESDSKSSEKSKEK